MNHSVICLVLSFFLQLLSSVGAAQGMVSGRVVNVAGSALAFATVYEAGSTNSTTSNEDGSFRLSLKEGRHFLIAQLIGYQKQIREIQISDHETVTLNFILNNERFMLQGAGTGDNEESRAKAIMRKAIQNRKYHTRQVQAYSCELYLRGMQRIHQRPETILGITITADTGIVYLSESISRIKFLQPDRMNETVLSAKVSGSNNVFGYHQASEMLIDLYQNTCYVEGLSERPFISPLSENAFSYYHYALAGTIIDNNARIHKIKVTPKRASDPAFSGHLYLTEDSWQLHSAELLLTRENGLEFVDTLQWSQIFAPVGYGILMPISQKITFRFDNLGFRGNGYFTGLYRMYRVQPNYEVVPAPDDTLNSSAVTSQKPLFGKESFSNAVIRVEADAHQHDSLYWAEARPIPLTLSETENYRLKDSVRIVQQLNPFRGPSGQPDRFKINNLLVKGYHYSPGNQRRHIVFPTLVQAVQYNAVEGLVTDLEFGFEKSTEFATAVRIRPSVRYGFANHTLQAKLEGYKMTDLKKREMLSGGFGRYTFQLNSQEPIAPLNNSFVTLTQARNLAKVYQKAFAEAGYGRELWNGIMVTIRMAYESRHPMTNHASYNFKHEPFKSNAPTNEELDNTDFEPHEALLAGLQIRIRFDQKYIEHPDYKIILESPYPDLHLYYKKAIPALGAEMDYDLAKIGLTHSLRLGTFGTSLWSAWAGTFLNNRTMTFVDFQHFNGNRTFITLSDGANLYQLLQYYTFSTQRRFAEFHYDHHFNAFLFSKIPGLQQLNVQAVASLNYLTTPTIGQYVELGAGVEHIFKVVRADFYTSFHNSNHYGLGFRLGFGF